MGVSASKPLVALVYRENAGCRQYPFASCEDLGAWARRHPYRDERLYVIAISDRRMVAEAVLPAAAAEDFVRQRIVSHL